MLSAAEEDAEAAMLEELSATPLVVLTAAAVELAATALVLLVEVVLLVTGYSILQSYTLRRPGPPQISVLLPLQTMLQPSAASAPSLLIWLSQSKASVRFMQPTSRGAAGYLQHSPPYSGAPARMYPASLQARVHKAAVMFSPGMV